MTRRSIRSGAVALGCAALLAVAGCGGATTAATPTPTGQGAQRQARAGGPFSQANMSALAKELGVSTTRLQQALAGARPAGAPNGTRPSGQQGSGTPPAGGPGGQMAANLAKALDLPTAKVQQALAKVMPGRPQGAATSGSGGN
ncbi:hypothetical protein [Candidatus Solirubrobacter pratensis]|uniref:hypothetical protein n=1 Tax=Candidatus Solirubrobacter pratensis TaxID=1298857 RepID=UPI0003FE160E|nr:hypothetical protein [Candidatus Solirubrobacter pratensis]